VKSIKKEALMRQQHNLWLLP